MPTAQPANDQARSGQSSGGVDVLKMFEDRLIHESGESDADQPDADEGADENEELDASSGTEGLGDDGDEQNDENESVDSDAHVIVDGTVYTAEAVRALLAETQQSGLREADYRRKTQVLARVRQEVEVTGEELTTTLQQFASLADRELQQFANVDWARLQAEAPDQHKALFARYQQARQGADQFKTILNSTRAEVETRRKAALAKQAEIGTEVLSSTIDGWGGELFGKLRAFAVETGRYTAEEFNDIADYRVVEGVHALYQREQARKSLQESVSKTKVKGQKKKAAAAAPTNAPQRRDKGGRFTDAAANLKQNRGDMGAAVNFFEQKLMREARGG